MALPLGLKAASGGSSTCKETCGGNARTGAGARAAVTNEGPGRAPWAGTGAAAEWTLSELGRLEVQGHRATGLCAPRVWDRTSLPLPPASTLVLSVPGPGCCHSRSLHFRVSSGYLLSLSLWTQGPPHSGLALTTPGKTLLPNQVTPTGVAGRTRTWLLGTPHSVRGAQPQLRPRPAICRNRSFPGKVGVGARLAAPGSTEAPQGAQPPASSSSGSRNPSSKPPESSTHSSPVSWAQHPGFL